MIDTLDRVGQVQQVLAALARHGNLISLALEGHIELGDKIRNRAIDELVSINALKPYEEGVYRLNPRLRDFIADHLLSYTAYQTLTRIHEQLHRSRTVWNEIKSMQEAGEHLDVDRLEWVLDDTITEIAYAIERNLQLLNSQVSTQYGSVEGLKAKLAQNTFYNAEVGASLREMEQVGRLVENISEEALAHGNFRIRQLVNRRLGVRLLLWRSQLKDAQAIISKRLFWARKMEKQLHNLSRASLWLSQNKTRPGFDFEVTENLPVALIRTCPVKVAPQLDVRDTDPIVLDGMVDAVARLPLRRSLVDDVDEAPRPQLVIASSEASVTVELLPEEIMLEELVSELMAPSSDLKTVSLLDWKAGQPLLDEFTAEEWLLYASGQLSAHGFPVHMVQALQQDPLPVNHFYRDFLVGPTERYLG